MNTAVAYLRGRACARPPFGRTIVIFVTILGLFLAPFTNKIAATSDQMRFVGMGQIMRDSHRNENAFRLYSDARLPESASNSLC